MNSDSNNIKDYSAEDIRRYWNNEMSSAEMHALEKAAMDDPFLADALEGYSKLQKDPSDDMGILQKRLAARSSGAAVVPMKRNNWWMAAAVLLLLVGLGTITLLMNQDRPATISKNEVLNDSAGPAAPLAQTEKEFSNDSQKSASSFSLSKQKAEQPTFASRDLKKIYKDRRSMNSKPDDSNASGQASSAPIENAKEGKRERTEPQVAAPSIAPFKKDQSDTVAGRAYRDDDRAKDLNVRTDYFNNFSGKVVDAQNNSIPYATVKMNNANQVASADHNGFFQFKSRDTLADISIYKAGYEERYMTMNSNQAGLNITLDALNNKGKLSEVGVKSVGKKNSDKRSQLQVYVMDAEPVIGWDKYNLYIDSNKKIPATEPAVTGEVVLSFRVNQKGELSSFEVEKSLNKTYDNEAIRLIKTGPAWRVTKGKKAKVKLIVKF